MGSDGFAVPERLARLGRGAERLYFVNFGIALAKLPAPGQRLLGKLGAPRDEVLGPHQFAPYAAQATEVLLDAIARSDGSRASVTRALRATRIEDGILGDIGFDANGDLTEGRVTLYRMAGGKPRVDRVVTVLGVRGAPTAAGGPGEP